MFRDHDVVVCLTRMPAMLIDASLRLVERLVAAKPTARTAPNNVVRPRVLPSLSFHYVHCARLREIDVTARPPEPSRARSRRPPLGTRRPGKFTRPPPRQTRAGGRSLLPSASRLNNLAKGLRPAASTTSCLRAGRHTADTPRQPSGPCHGPNP